MTAPTFKKATHTEVDPTDVKFGAPDLSYTHSVLDGTHSSDRIQLSVIEGKDRYATFAFFVRQTPGSSDNYQAIRGDTTEVAFSGSDFGVVMNSVIDALPAPSAAQPIARIYLNGTTLDCTTTRILVNKPCIIDGLGSAIVRKTTDYSTPNRSIFEIDSSSDVTIRDIILEVATGADNSAQAIRCVPSAGTGSIIKNILLDKIRIKNTAAPIYIEDNDNAGRLIEDVIIRDIWIDNRDFTTSASPGIFLGLGCKTVSVEACRIVEPGNYGIEVSATEEFIKLLGNIIWKETNTAGGGIIVSDRQSTSAARQGAPTQHVVIRDNRVYGPTQDAMIKVWGGAEKVFVTNNFLKGGSAQGLVITDRVVEGTSFWAKEVQVLGNIIQEIGAAGILLQPESSGAIEFQGFQIVGNYISNTQSIGINIGSGGKHMIIANNMIYRYGLNQASSMNGIRLLDVTDSIIMGNKIFGLTSSSTPPAGTGYASIRETGAGSDNNIIVGNSTNDAPILFVGAGTIIMLNDGFRTANAGTVNLTSGNTSVTVSHGLAYTPTLKDIAVTPVSSWGSMTRFWVSSPTSTQFTINGTPDPGQTVTFAWQISRSY